MLYLDSSFHFTSIFADQTIMKDVYPTRSDIGIFDHASNYVTFEINISFCPGGEITNGWVRGLKTSKKPESKPISVLGTKTPRGVGV
jgi:hypothetical protein